MTLAAVPGSKSSAARSAIPTRGLAAIALDDAGLIRRAGVGILLVVGLLLGGLLLITAGCGPPN
jgi:hypothetical protein